MNTETQRQIVLAHLQTQGSLTTLHARGELHIMSIAARIFELKERGHNIVTQMVPAIPGKKPLIANYVLLSGGSSHV